MLLPLNKIHIKARIFRRIQCFFDKCGWHVTRVEHTLAHHRMKIIKNDSISLVIDVGANDGEWASDIRTAGYKGKLISFEPLAAPYLRLKEKARKGQNHLAFQLALGNKEAEALINVSEINHASSLFSVSKRLIAAFPKTKIVRQEKIQIIRLDTIKNDIVHAEDRIYLKADTQGFEREVLLGAQDTLKQIVAIELELSLIPLYIDQPLISNMIDFMACLGYEFIWLERGTLDPITGFMLQLDALFYKRQAINGPDISQTHDK